MGTKNQRDAVVNTTMGNDVKHKISKLEADSRQLCINLRNLQKNRAELTNEAVALSQELERPTFRGDQDEAKCTEPDCIHVLLDAKHTQNDCCTICTCSECGDYSEVADDIEEKYLEEPFAKTLSTEEHKGHEFCYICYKNGAINSRYVDQTASNHVSIIDNKSKATRIQEKVDFCSTCSVKGQSCSDHCEICDCKLDYQKNAEERCRGGMDHVETRIRSVTRVSGDTNNERKKRMCEGCACNLCALRNVEGASPPCLMMCESAERLSNGNDEQIINYHGISSGDAPAKLQQICKVEKLREVLEQLKNRNHSLRKMLNDCDCLSQSSVNLLAPEKAENEFRENQDFPEARNLITRSTSGLIATVKFLQNKCRTKDGMILALAEALKKLASPDKTDRILKKLTDPCTNDSPVRDLDRSELWKYLKMEDPPKQMQQDERVSVDGKNFKKDFLMILLILYFIASSQIFRHYGYYASVLLLEYFTRFFNCLKQFSDHTFTEFPKIFLYSAMIIKHFSAEFKAEAIKSIDQAFIFLGEYLNFFSSHLTCVGAIFGSLSFAKTAWSLGKKLIIWKKDSSYENNIENKFFRPVKLFAVQIICYTKSQYYFFSYLSCLALGFLASKMSTLVDKWPAIL